MLLYELQLTIRYEINHLVINFTIMVMIMFRAWWSWLEHLWHVLAETCPLWLWMTAGRVTSHTPLHNLLDNNDHNNNHNNDQHRTAVKWWYRQRVVNKFAVYHTLVVLMIMLFCPFDHNHAHPFDGLKQLDVHGVACQFPVQLGQKWSSQSVR